MKTITVFNHKGGVGKTTVVFNLGVALGKKGYRVLLADLDPQANLTALCLDEDAFEGLYSAEGWTIAAAMAPIVSGQGDFALGDPVKIRDNVALIPGDIRLADFEALLPTSLTEALAGRERGFRIVSAPYRLLWDLGRRLECDYVLCDVGPNVGALNQALITSMDYLILPVASDLFSLRALDTVGHSIGVWATEWNRALSGAPSLPFEVPQGRPQLLGYVTQQFGIYGGRPASAYRHWQEQLFPEMIRRVVRPLGRLDLVATADDDLRLADIRNFHSLAPKAQERHKAVFELDHTEAIGQHQETVKEADAVFSDLADRIVAQIGR